MDMTAHLLIFIVKLPFAGPSTQIVERSLKQHRRFINIDTRIQFSIIGKQLQMRITTADCIDVVYIDEK
jgi:hypothetical protein